MPIFMDRHEMVEQTAEETTAADTSAELAPFRSRSLDRTVLGAGILGRECQPRWSGGGGHQGVISGQAARGAQRDKKLLLKQTHTGVAGNYQLRVMGREAVMTNGRRRQRALVKIIGDRWQSK